MHPKTKGAKVIYDGGLRKLFANYEEKIDLQLSQLDKRVNKFVKSNP